MVSLLFRYCAAQHSSVVWLCMAERCAHLRLPLSLFLSVSTCWTGSTNYTYYCQKVSVKQGGFIWIKVYERDRASKKPRILVIFQRVRESAIKWRWSLNFIRESVRKIPLNGKLGILNKISILHMILNEWAKSHAKKDGIFVDISNQPATMASIQLALGIAITSVYMLEICNSVIIALNFVDICRHIAVTQSVIQLSSFASFRHELNRWFMLSNNKN